MAHITFTSNMNEKLMNELDFYASRLHKNKKQIIESALSKYFENLKKAEYAMSFKKAANDKEILTMAEEGLEEYIKLLDKK